MSTIRFSTLPTLESAQAGDEILARRAGAYYRLLGSALAGGGVGGNVLRHGAGSPASGLGADGDFYIDTTADALYGPKTTGAWGSPTSLIGPQGAQGPAGAQGPQGPQGLQGPAGAQGPQGPQGEQGPAGADGADGADGEQGPAGVQGPAGAAGADGRTVLSGTGAPGAGVGVDGDFYLNTTSSTLYGPKAAGSWPAGVSLIGPQGPAGADGAQGPAGAAGADGADGADGQGVPTGGTTGQYLRKASATNYDTAWDTLTPADAGAEPALGNPASDGYVLSSTAGGVRSWVAQAGGGGGVSSVNGETGAVTLDAGDVGAAAASHTHAIADVTGLLEALDGKAAASHTHTASQISDLAEAVEDRIGAAVVAGDNVTVSYNDTTGQTTVAVPSVPWADLTGVPSTFAPSAHAASHADGGGDELALDGSQITSGAVPAARLPAASTSAAGIVELATSAETTAGLVVQASDTRLSDARTPTAHTHDVDDINATGTPSSSTYLRGDGSWATPAGGGGGLPFTLSPNHYTTFCATRGLDGGFTFWNGNAYYFPLLIPKAGTITEISFAVTEHADAGKTMTLALYEVDSSLQPQERIYLSSALDMSTTGAKTQTVSIACDAAVYLIGMSLSGYLNLRCFDAVGEVFPILAMSTGSNQYLGTMHKGSASLTDPGTAWDSGDSAGNGFKFPFLFKFG